MKIKMIRDDLETREEDEFDIEKGMTIGEFLGDQGIERQEVLVSRDGKIVSETAKLKPEDEIEVFDVIAGG